MSVRRFLAVLLLSLVGGSASPLPGRPFLAVWNAPTSLCWEKYGVDLDLAPFDIVVNHNQSFEGGRMVIFYSSQLGLYPHYEHGERPVNGGLPQNASLNDHLTAAYRDLNATIPSPDFQGVAVIDWESWRPIWERNWDEMEVYRRRSEERVRERHPYWPAEKVTQEAKREFQEAAEAFMASTLELGGKLRPGGLWGFYGFPSCYNNDYKKGGHNYSGECPEVERARNDLLTWLWGASRALYPSIYLEQMLRASPYVQPFVHHRLLEAFRVSAGALQEDLPVMPYARIVYTYSMDFLTPEDLVQTIGQSAALGCAGAILWGNADYSSSKEACLAVKSYMDDTLGRYVVNVTSGAALCSQALCAGRGRCVRQDSASDSHLHLHPESFNITRNTEGRGFQITGEPSKPDLLYLTAHFHCRCYPGWEGPDCSRRPAS